MRITHIFIILLFTQYDTVMGQISIGFKGGPNLNNTVIKSDDPNFPDLSDPTISFHVGLFTTLRITDKFLLIPELQFIQKGYSLSAYRNGNNKVVYKNRINYIEIPLLISYSIFKYINIEAGFVTGFKISAVYKEGSTKKNVTGEFESFLDLGLASGVRINLTERLGLTGRYVWSLTPLDKSDPNISAQVTKEYNRNLLVSVTYTVRTKKDKKK